MNLDSDPKNPPRNDAIRPKNEFIEMPLKKARQRNLWVVLRNQTGIWSEFKYL